MRGEALWGLECTLEGSGFGDQARERRGITFKGLKDVYLKAKARIWP